ncbi:MAG TPA: DUF3488 and transglutaminase-like domain-containing protein [Dissulfurispiraceae bacterium]|nr:DUF3488 and transglutaminase-like domain-containing protein [Dissulfurispiraceae bacterium]
MTSLRKVYSVGIVAALNVLTYAAGLVAFISVVRYVGTVFSLAFAAIFIFAIFFDYYRRYAIPRIVLNALLVFFIALNFLRITRDDIATPVVEALLILIAVKFLEEKKARDYLQIYAIATLLLTGSALMTLDLQFLLNLVILSFLLPLCIVLLTFYSEDSQMTLTNTDLSHIVSKALLIPLISVPVTALMFVVLPRSDYPLLNFLNRSGAMAGFSDKVKLGDVSIIQENSAVALRVETQKVDDVMLYWRGIVLDYFDGSSWAGPKKRRVDNKHMSFSGKRVMQTAYLEPYENKYLFALDKPLSVDYKGAEISGDLTATAMRDIDRRIKYTAVSVLSNVALQEKIDTAQYLQLPHRDFSRIAEIVRGFTPGEGDISRAEAMLHYLRDGQFAYSLKGLPVTDRPVEDFLLKYKYGNCEYFASSLAVMLRIAGIPARLVAGYRGGVYNNLGGYYLVTQNNAHVWVEAYIGNAWIRMDPTPGSSGAFPGGGSPGFLLQARLLFDALNYYWNAMVIGFDLNKQISILAGFRNAIRGPGIDMSGLKRYSYIAAFSLIAVIATGVALYFYVRRKPPDKQIVERFMKIMEKKGYMRSRSRGLREFAEGVVDPELREKALIFVDGFEGLYYRDREITGSDLARLRQLIDEL